MISPETFKVVLIEEFEKSLQVKKLDALLALILDDENLGDEHPTRPGKPTLDGIRKTTEVAFQRAIFNGTDSILHFHDHEKRINWLDLELPVMLSASSRRKSVDLIGEIDTRPTLCELKFMDQSAGDHPIYAIFELATYYYFVLCNHDKLDKAEVHHTLDSHDSFEWKDVVCEEPLLLVAANQKYWDYWLNSRGYLDEVLTTIKNLNAKLQTHICAFQLEDVDFKSQRGDKDTYKPEIYSRGWQQI